MCAGGKGDGRAATFKKSTGLPLPAGPCLRRTLQARTWTPKTSVRAQMLPFFTGFDEPLIAVRR